MQIEGALHPKYRPPQSYLPILPAPKDISWITDADEDSAVQIVKHIELRESILQRHAYDNFLAFFQYAFYNDKLSDDGMSIVREPIQPQWYQEDWSNALKEHQRVIIISPRGHGKCVTKGTLIHSADGKQIPVEDWQGGQVLSLDSDYKVRPHYSPASKSDGVKACVTVHTGSGRQITVSMNHPFEVGDGWKEAGDIKVGDHVGIMRGCEPIEKETAIDKLDAYAMGLLVGDGCLSSSPVITTTYPDILKSIEEWADSHDWEVNLVGKTKERYGLSGHGLFDENKPTAWCRRHGLVGTSYHKVVPPVIMESPRKIQMSFISGYFDTDGTANELRGGSAEFYSVSKQLLAGVQEMLGRNGINSVLAVKRGLYKGERHLSWRLTLRGVDLERFGKLHSAPNLTEKGRKLRRIAINHNTNHGGGARLYTVPYHVWRPKVKSTQRKMRDRRCRIDMKRAICMTKVAKIAKADNNETLHNIADGHIVWEKVTKVEPAGMLPVYDLTVPDTHNFVAQGFITHNTTFITARAIWEIGRNPALRIKIVCAADGMAKQRLYEIKNHIENNDRVKQVFPTLRRAAKGEWSRHKLYLENDSWHRDASIEAFSITATITGARADILISDDAVDRRNSISLPKLRQSIKQTWKSDITQLLEPTSKIWAIATPWHRDDLTHDLMKNSVFRRVLIKIEDDYGAMFPDKWDEKALRLRALEIGSQEFARGFKCVALDDATQLVKVGWIHFIDPAKIPDGLVIFCSYDTAKGLKEVNDYTAGVIIGVDEKNKVVYVLDAWHARLTLDKVSERIHDDIVYWNPYRTLIEDVGLSATFSWLLNMYPELTGTVIAVNPKGNKYERLRAVTPLMEQRRVYFSTDLDSLNPNDTFEPGRGDLVNELLEFGLVAHDDMCMAKGTMIATIKGDVPIEEVQVGDYVLTPLGSRRVVSSGPTGKAVTAKWKNLNGTGSHPVFVHKNGFTRLDALTQAAKVDRLSLGGLLKWIYRVQSNNHLRFGSTKSSTEGWVGRDIITLASRKQTKGEKHQRGFTLPSGNMSIKNRFKRACASITRIVTRSIMTLITWNVYRVRTMQNSLRSRLSCWNTWKGFGRWLRSGTDLQKGELGTRYMPRYKEENTTQNVSIVEKILSKNKIEQNTALAYVDIGTGEMPVITTGNMSALFVGKHLKQCKLSILAEQEKHVAKSASQYCEKKQWKETVYNLTVEGAGCYYANGYLVSNCDAFSQGVNEGARKYLLDDWAPGTDNEDEELDVEDFILGGY